MSRQGSQRIEYLDSVRGLASMVVLLQHSIGVIQMPQSFYNFFWYPIVALLVDGKAAVCMFFVLSGFVLSRPYIKSFAERGRWTLRPAQFYIKRIARIYIPFFCVLALCAVVRVWLYPRYETLPPASEHFQSNWSIPLTARSLVKQCFFLEHNAFIQLINQDWSLGVELKASAMMPFLLLALGRGPGWLMGVGAVLLVFVGTGQYYFSFLLGIFLAAYGERWGAAVKAHWSWLKWLLLVVGLTIYHGLLIHEYLLVKGMLARSHPHYTWVSSSLGCAVFLFVICNSPRLQHLLNRRVLVFLGRISYGVYLLHYFVLLWIVTWLIHELNKLGLHEPYLLMFVALVTTIGATVGIATVFYRLVEEPSIRLGKSLAKACGERFGPRPTSADNGELIIAGASTGNAADRENAST